jgi:hypothetical protein
MVIKNVQVIVICVNYSDFLSITYRKNINFFERENYHVITTKEDSDTINLCEELKINYTFYNYFYKNSSFFNKSGAINNMQIKLHDKYPDDWILLLDADIILPNNFEEMYNSNCKDKTALYSLERKDYEHQEDYKNLKNEVEYCGINFMGFMQLYFDKSKYYPKFSIDCCTCDAIFRDYFYNTLTLLDKNSYLIHIGKNHVNNRGRITEKWNNL